MTILLIVTSRHPDDLYKNGIQRSSFIPCIELLKERFEVTDLDSGTGIFSYVHVNRGSLTSSQTTVGYPDRCRTYTTTHSPPTTKQK